MLQLIPMRISSLQMLCVKKRVNIYTVNRCTISVGMAVACYVSDYADEEPQLGKIVALENDGESAMIEWMTGTYY